MIKKWLVSLRFFLLFIFIYSCNFNPGEMETPSWESSFIGPLTNAKITLDDLLDFDSLGFEYKVAASELSNEIPPQGGTIPFLPPFTVDSLPGDTFDITDGFRYAIFDSGEIFFEFINSMPFTLNPGQIISVFSVTGPNQNIRGDKIFDFTLSAPLSANEKATSIFADFTGLVVSSRLMISIGNVSSNGSNSQLTFTENSGFELKFAFRNIKVREVGISANNSFMLSDTTPFSFGSGTIPSELESGILRLKFRNGVPLNIDLQLDLFDKDFNLISNFIRGDNNNIAASDTSSLVFEINQNNVDDFKNSSYLVSSIVLSDQAAIGDTVIINTDSLIGVKAIGELDLKFAP